VNFSDEVKTTRAVVDCESSIGWPNSQVSAIIDRWMPIQYRCSRCLERVAQADLVHLPGAVVREGQIHPVRHLGIFHLEQIR